ncbi:MAG: MarR family transcriptional regulator [Myxococcales bacterium]|nr:MarR family transcriptional regulator [Myxococcales bacterium]
MTSPSAPELEYIERFARLFEDSGSSRIMGRIFAWLMICEPPEQSQPELAARLGVSKASVSTEVRALMSRGLVERTTRPGDRRSYYQIPAGGWAALLERRLRVFEEFREVAREGLGLLADAPARRRARLTEMRRVYAHMERALRAALVELRAHAGRRTQRR